MRLVYTLELPVETPSNNTIKGMHFHAYKKLREDWKFMVAGALGDQPTQAALEQAHIEIDRHCSGALDWDNAYGGTKPLMDCLVQPSNRNPNGLGLIVDDNPACIPSAPVLRQFKTKRGQGRTVVRIYSLND